MKAFLLFLASCLVVAWKLGYVGSSSKAGPRACDPSNRLCVWEAPGPDANTVDFVAQSSFSAPVTVELEIFSRDTKVPDGDPKVEMVEQAGSKRLLRFPKPSQAKFWPPPFTYHFLIGDPEAVHDSYSAYTLPFEKGQTVVISQGFTSRGNHTGPRAYAIDFQAPEDTPVHAAREGVVVDVLQSLKEIGGDGSGEDGTNFVKVMQPDRTIAQYYHFKQDGVSVKVNQKVAAGDLLGVLGKPERGESHLHFEVYRPKTGTQLESIPVLFHLGDKPAPPVELREGQTYQR